MEPAEVDGPHDVATGHVPGIKNAAKRKLNHELGIPLEQINVEDMVFVTRLRYWAADTVTHGPKAPWGEHEIDYVLIWPINSSSNNKNEKEETLTLVPDPDEVQAVRWVTPDELMAMMHQDKDLLFSPWFRLICQRWLVPTWWKDLDGTLKGSYADYKTIHSFDPPPEHYGGAGDAAPMFLVGDER